MGRIQSPFPIDSTAIKKGHPFQQRPCPCSDVCAIHGYLASAAVLVITILVVIGAGAGAGFATPDLR